ncbi:MAG: DUF1007 family protein [Sneathiella sp.]
MRWFLIACCLMVMTPFKWAYAHPHAWADVVIEILFDGAGRVTGLRQTWLFDDFYSAYAVEGMDGNGDGKPDQEKLDGILRVNMENLKESDYFMRAWQGEKILKLQPVIEMSTRMAEGRLEMTFVTTFSKPVSQPGDQFSYSIFDPTFYIEMLHSETEKPVRLVGAPEGCDYALLQPNPDPNAVAQAAMLGASERGETGLGLFFAERVSLTCPAN